MTVRDVKKKAAAWTMTTIAPMEGFQGAFYHGSINWLEDDASFPATSDLDLIVVVTDPEDHRSGKRHADGLILEVTFMSMEAFLPVERLLGTFYLAGSFARTEIIADPDGRLKILQQQVAEKYAQSRWVQQRCLDVRDRSLGFMDQMEATLPLHDQVTGWLFSRGLMAHMLLVAGLENPTVRKRYAATRRLLKSHGLQDKYPLLLSSARFDRFSIADVERHLITLTAAFDDACAVITTPYRFASDISMISRPLTIDGSYELLRTGYYQEAMFWIVASWCRCRHVLFTDGSVSLQQQHDVAFMQLLEELGIALFNERVDSNLQARALLPVVTDLARTIIRRTPQIFL